MGRQVGNFVILAGIAGLYYLITAKKGPPVNCPGAPGCPGATASSDNTCPLGYSSFMSYDPTTDSFYATCEALQKS